MNYQLSCENKLQSIANNFKDMGNALYAMGLVDEIQGELTGSNTIAAFSIQKAIENKEPTFNIIKCVKDMIKDGWEELSLDLSYKVSTFNP